MSAHEVFLMAGQWYFGARADAVRTLLGSCVAVVLWHPQRRIGGMCHYLLPTRPAQDAEGPSARYGDDALALLGNAVHACGTRAADYEAHLYGGADTFPDQDNRMNIGERNIAFGFDALSERGFRIAGVDVGDHVPRSVTLDLRRGAVQVRRGRDRNREETPWQSV